MSSKRLTTYAEDVLFDAAFLEEYFSDDCQWLVALTDWQLSVILSAVRYAHWEARWVNYSDWSEIFWKVQELENCLMSGCQVQDLVDAVESIANKLTYNDKSIAQIVYETSSEETVTLQEYIDNFEADDIIEYPWLYAILTMINDILPTSLTEQYRLRDPAAFTLDILRGFADLITGILQAGFSGAEAAAETGSAVADVAGTAVEGLDTIFQGVTAGALSLQAIIDLINLFKSGQEPDSDVNPDLRALTRVYNQFSAEITNSIENDINLDICCYNPGQLPTVEADEGSQLDPDTPPTSWPGTLPEYNAYKCKAANLLVDAYLEYLDKAVRFLTYGNVTNTAMGAWLAIVPEIYGALTLVGALPLLFAYLVTVITGGFAMVDFINGFKSNLESDKEEGVCGLYNALSASEAKFHLSTWFSDNLPVVAPDSWVNWHIARLFTNDVINILFEAYDPASNYSAGTVDCSMACDSCPDVYFEYGSYSAGVFYSEPHDGLHKCYLWINYNGSSHCGPAQTMNISDLNGYTQNGSDSDPFLVRDIDSTIIWQSQSQWPNGTCGGYFRIRSATPFTCTFERGECT